MGRPSALKGELRKLLGYDAVDASKATGAAARRGVKVKGMPELIALALALGVAWLLSTSPFEF